MTDKIGEDALLPSIGCTDPGTCFLVHHSCTVLLKILGSTSWDEMLCGGQSQSIDLVDWPTKWTGVGGAVVDGNI
eukprot:CAMPEP_0194449378 /NCGR_PEP_ID=MMETSP0176-20130528/130111_1 /TAXON_ID=216777 /ORGANISM="Proboscia alata, Strain PI-D3" /LENGTH=74 /DNA_ID=CAMNT_0039276497 /DNA_START=888 /DNA_END=1112 /DNA_ORIENTATION=+